VESVKGERSPQNDENVWVEGWMARRAHSAGDVGGHRMPEISHEDNSGEDDFTQEFDEIRSVYHSAEK